MFLNTGVSSKNLGSLLWVLVFGYQHPIINFPLRINPGMLFFWTLWKSAIAHSKTP
ncbi:MAG: hypothetical protein PT118_11325 [Aphanizomenon gracile PMC644.10]|nr:hypothetical protein [Aphanizomenon gracile PMC644.10]